MPKEIETKLGKMVFTEDVIATMAGVAATECYGIVGMTSRKLTDGIAELLGRDSLTRGVEVTIDDEMLAIDLYVIVGYGTRISEVAQNVISNVTYAVQSMTGLRVERVSIHVQGVRVGHH